MKLLRGILFGALFWLLVFVEISITMIGLKLSNSMSWMIHDIILIPIMALIAHFYYKSKDKINGFFLGLIFLATGIVLDMITTVPLFIIPQGGNYLTYFTNTYMLVGFAESVLVVGFYDLFQKKNKH